jgi:GDPmannose 4,6-dehydratase
MWMMLQQASPESYVIATGESHTLEQFVERAFAEVGLAWRDHVNIDARLLRPADISFASANPSRANERLGWKARARMPEVVRRMIEAQLTESGP